MFGAGGETRTHVGFPTAYKTVAIAAMRLQQYILAGSIGFEPMRPFLNDGLAIHCINHSTNFPYFYQNALLLSQIISLM